MASDSSREIIEIYKIHAELADRAGQRREGANRLYVSLLSAIAVLMGILARFEAGGLSQEVLLSFLGALGLVISFSWWIVIRSYKQLNSGKFEMLHELERKLPYQAFRREWHFLGEGKKLKVYSKLTTVEGILPASFGIGFILLILYFWIS